MGTGIERIKSALQDAECPPVEISFTTFFTLLFPRPQPSTMEVAMEVTMEVKRLLNALSGELSRQELQKRLALKNADHFRKAYILPALSSGLIEMTLPDKPNSRLQKYRLTDKGKIYRNE
jgi:ATP-dependent DNA helicase RecG